mgnify:CR=1 FL=1
MTSRIGGTWLAVFAGNTAFYSAAYWDLLTGIWYEDAPLRKTDALKLMTAVKSAHTAGKYVETAIEHGFLEEIDNPADARSKLVALAPEMRRMLDGFFDSAVGELRQSNATIEGAGAVPKET